MTRCLRCNEELTPGKRFCGDCGAPTPPAPCGKCGAPWVTGKKFCGDCGSPATAPLAQSGSITAPAAPAPRAPEPTLPKDERRIVTVLFADLSGFTALSETRDPEEMTALMNRCFAALTACVETEGGFVDKFMGDCVMALFGAPYAHDDDPLRAVACACAMQIAIARLREQEGLDLGLSIGVNTGRVLAGRVGAGARAGFTVMGDTVNVTQRLQSKAARGEILVSHATARQLEGRHELIAQPPLSMKNRKEPVIAYRIGALVNRPPVHVEPFYGRALELAALEEALASARMGAGRCVVLTGASGTGKSRIAQELCARLRPDAEGRVPRVLAGRSQHVLGARPYGPWREMVRELFDLSDDLSPDLLREALVQRAEPGLEREAVWYLADLLGASFTDTPLPALSPDSRAANLRLMLRKTIAWTTSERPAVLIFDDAQWADEGTGAALSYLLLHLERLPIVLLILKHDETPASLKIPEKSFVRRLTLAPWSEDDVRAYLRLRGIDAAGAAAGAPRLHQCTGGQPAYVELILRDWQDRGVWRVGQPLPTSAPLPEALESAYLARLDRLDGPVRVAAVTAALLGRSFQKRHLDGLLGDDSASALEALVTGDVVVEESPPPEAAYLFRGEGLRETAAGVHTRQRAKELLGRLALLLEGEQSPEASAIAHAWLGAGEPARAAAWLMTAGEEAFAASRYRDAEAHFQRVLDQDMSLHASGQDRRRAASRLASAFEITSRWQDALAACDVAEQALPTPCPEVDARRCAVLSLLGKTAEAIVAGERAVAAANALGDRAAEALALHLLGNALWLCAENVRAHAMLEESLRIHRALGDRAGEARSVNSLGLVAIARGDAAAARDLFQQAMDLRRTLGDRVGIAQSLGNLGAAYYYLGDHERSRQLLEESLEPRRALGDRYGEATSLGNLGELAMEDGEVEQGLSRLRAAQTIYDELESGSPVFLITIAEACRRLGRLDDAEGAIGTARERLSSARADQVGRFHLITGHIARDRGDTESARAAYSACAAFAAEKGLIDVTATNARSALDALERGEPIPHQTTV